MGFRPSFPGQALGSSGDEGVCLSDSRFLHHRRDPFRIVAALLPVTSSRIGLFDVKPGKDTVVFRCTIGNRLNYLPALGGPALERMILKPRRTPLVYARRVYLSKSARKLLRGFSMPAFGQRILAPPVSSESGFVWSMGSGGIRSCTCRQQLRGEDRLLDRI